jgi:hypothetical protein
MIRGRSWCSAHGRGKVISHVYHNFLTAQLIGKMGGGGEVHFVLPLTLVNFILVSCSTPTTLSMAIPEELAGAIPLINRFQVGRYIFYLLT